MQGKMKTKQGMRMSAQDLQHIMNEQQQIRSDLLSSPDIFNVTDMEAEKFSRQPTLRRSIGGRVSKSTSKPDKQTRGFNVRRTLRLLSRKHLETKTQQKSMDNTDNEKDTSKAAPKLTSHNTTPNTSNIFNVSECRSDPLGCNIPAPIDGSLSSPSPVPRSHGSMLGNLSSDAYHLPSTSVADAQPVTTNRKKSVRSRIKKTFTFRKEKSCNQDENNVVTQCTRKKDRARRAPLASFENSSISLNVSELVRSPRKLASTATRGSCSTSVLQDMSVWDSKLDFTLPEGDSLEHTLDDSSFMMPKQYRCTSEHKIREVLTPCGETTPILEGGYYTRSIGKHLADLSIKDNNSTPIYKSTTKSNRVRKRLSMRTASIGKNYSMRQKLKTAISDNVSYLSITPNRVLRGPGNVMREDAGHTPRATRRKNLVDYDERLI